MPSAEKLTSATAVKPEVAPTVEPCEPKTVESSQKEISQNASESEKSVPAIQQVISIISNKIRNLEKRKNKLDGYVKEEEDGKELSSEQQRAVLKYDEVVQQLSLSKEFCKQFSLIATSASKDAKREARKNLYSRQIQETAKVREVLLIQDLLQRFKLEGIRNDFLNKRNGACSVDKVEMGFIDKFAQQVVPTRPNFSNEPSFTSSAKTSADHFSFLIDGRNRQFMDTSLTYENGRELLNRIQSCGYWEKDVKIVEVVETVEESRATNDTPHSDDLDSKDENAEESSEKSHPVSAPAPTQVPTPTFNGNVNMMPVQQQQQHQQRLQHQAPMARVPQQQHQQAPLPEPTKTTVTAVENAYFNQMKYSPQLNNGLPVVQTTPSDFTANFSFLQDSELDSPAAPGAQQQKMPVNVIQTVNQPKHSPVQHQQRPPVSSTQAYKGSNFHPTQSPVAGAGQRAYPPGLKVQPTLQNVTNIPVNYQPQQQPPLNQQTSSQVPSHMIPKQQPVNGGGSQMHGYAGQSQTPPNTQQQTSRPAAAAYPPVVPKAQYQQQPNLSNVKPMESKPVMTPKNDGSGDGQKSNAPMQEKEDYQQQPQIDTWTNETAAQSGGNNFSSRPAGGFSRNGNRSTGGGNREGNGGGARDGNAGGPRDGTAGGGGKYNNYRNPQQSRNYTENGSGDSPRDGTFFRNNDRYHGSQGGNFKQRDNAGGNVKQREPNTNYRAGSGRFAGSAAASAAQGSTNPGQRK